MACRTGLCLQSIVVLQLGQFINEKVILGVTHFFWSSYLTQLKWNTWPHPIRIAGSAPNPLIKQIPQYSSALMPGSSSPFPSFLSSLFSSPAHFSYKQGKHSASPMKPPHLWPHLSFLLQATSTSAEQAAAWHTSSLFGLLAFLPISSSQ